MIAVCGLALNGVLGFDVASATAVRVAILFLYSGDLPYQTIIATNRHTQRAIAAKNTTR
jgi:hypothetical protein